MALRQHEHERMTIAQENQLAATRDCPHCPGTLKRTNISMSDRTVVEEYRHVGDEDCPGHNPKNGLLESSGTHVEHWRDKSIASGALRGEF